VSGRLDGKVCVITGASSGIGAETARRFLEEGATVVGADLRDDGVGTVARAVDVADEDQVAALYRGVGEEFGRVDVLFNNAGQNVPGVAFEDLPYEKWQSVVDANFSGTFLCAQAAYRIMKDQDPRGGRIINNGSISAHTPRPDSAPYTSTKHGVSGLTRTIALDGRKYDIACCQIDVGNAMSELASRMSSGVKQADGSVKTEPMIDVKDVARSVLFMANQPLDVNIYHLTVMATKMPYAGRG